MGGNLSIARPLNAMRPYLRFFGPSNPPRGFTLRTSSVPAASANVNPGLPHNTTSQAMSDSEEHYSSDTGSDAGSGSDLNDLAVDASYHIHLKDLKTIRELYELGVLRARPPHPASSVGATQSAPVSSTTTTDPTASTAAKDPSPEDASATDASATSAPVPRTYEANPAFLGRITLFQGDITKLVIDAIVNAANKSLLGGGGVDGAIHAAAGPKLVAECRQLNGARTGESKITRGYNLPASYVIHTVGPVYSASEREEKAALLTSCYQTSLEVAAENQLKHLAFPSVSTGIYGYPIIDATHIALRTVREFLDTRPGEKLERVVFVVWSNRDKEVYEELIPEYFPLAATSSKEESSSKE